ncbi:MAG: hypothetical protein IJJ25_10030 [Lachnospiraceae bacterium]|nr:hypothetical protein [Lachnospiraceae bacterium]
MYHHSILLILCAIFYAVLCVFSIVTGIIYMTGKKELNPLELSDRFMARLSDPAKRNAFARKMGLVTFIVGIVQGITAYCIFRAGSPVHYWFAFGFNAFSICSVLMKLKGKINAFPLLKLAAYTAILLILLLGNSKRLFFS